MTAKTIYAYALVRRFGVVHGWRLFMAVLLLLALPHVALGAIAANQHKNTTVENLFAYYTMESPAGYGNIDNRNFIAVVPRPRFTPATITAQDDGDRFALMVEGGMVGSILGMGGGGGLGLGWQGHNLRFLITTNYHSLGSGVSSIPVTFDFSYRVRAGDFYFTPGFGVGPGVMLIDNNLVNNFSEPFTDKIKNSSVAKQLGIDFDSKFHGVIPLPEVYLTPKLGFEWQVSEAIGVGLDLKMYLVVPVVVLSYGAANVTAQFSF